MEHSPQLYIKYEADGESGVGWGGGGGRMVENNIGNVIVSLRSEM